MEQSPKTSFIPKQTIGVAKSRQRQSFNMFTVVAMIIFLAVLVLSVGVFFYERYAQSELAIQKERLAEFRNKFSSDAEENVEAIRMLERRFEVADHLLDRHVALSKVFDAIEDRTQSNTQFTTFEFTRGESGNAQVVLAGTAGSFNTVALQERQLSEESVFEPGSVMFSGFNTSEDGSVVFSAAARVDTAAVAYTADDGVETGPATTTPVSASSSVPVSATTSTPAAPSLSEPSPQP